MSDIYKEYIENIKPMDLTFRHGLIPVLYKRRGSTLLYQFQQLTIKQSRDTSGDIAVRNS